MRSTAVQHANVFTPPLRPWATLLLLLACGCGSSDLGPRVEDVLLRERVAAHFRLADFGEARRSIAPLLEREPPAVEDLLRRVNIELADSKVEAAQRYLEEARARAQSDPSFHWSIYRIARADGDFEAALSALERLRALVPDDYPTLLALANMLEEAGRDAEAEEHYLSLLARADTIGDGWSFSTTYRMFSFLQRRERVDEALLYQKELQRFEEEGVVRLGPTEIDRGSFGAVLPPARGEIDTEGEWGAWMGTERIEGSVVGVLDGPFAGCAHIRSVTRNDRWSWTEALWRGEWIARDQALREDSTEKSLLVKRVERMPAEVFGWGPGGLKLAGIGGEEWSVETVLTEPVTFAVSLDLDLSNLSGGQGAEKFARDGLLDFVVATREGLFVLEQKDGAWNMHGQALLPPDVPVSDIEPIDFDHDGDLDLLVVGPAGVRLLRNDGYGVPGGGFYDATLEAGLPRERGFSWCLAEDPDADNDVDLLMGGADGAHLWLNERGGRFTAFGGELPEALRSEKEPVCADLNADGWPDFVAQGRSFAGLPRLSWVEGANAALPPEGLDSVCIATPYGEPRARLLTSLAGGEIEAREITGSGSTALVKRDGALGGSLVATDVTGDGFADLVEADGSSLRSHAMEGDGHTISIALQGVKDNRRAVGALLELRAGPLYRRIYWNGEPQAIGLGVRDQADIVRITWPNGIVQETIDLLEGSYLLRQREGLGGSCPFLYTWNGNTYEFVSDVLGITPLGLPMARGQLVPPDHDEYVLIRGDQLQEKDGFFDLQLTEELREVTYLDRVRLDVVDHPVGTEIYPNELFCFPPFPEAHTHTVRAPVKPVRAEDDQGRDWAGALSEIDGTYAVPFEPLFGQFLGLATPHTLELSFDRDAVRDARKLRLVMTGWFYWTDASVNVAAGCHPEIAFDPPQLSVPDREGGWLVAGPPVGFPAGKRKTIVVDISEILVRDDPRLRLSSTLQLYWDSIRLAIDDDDAELLVAGLEPVSAELWDRGFSEPLPVMGVPGMDWFDWERVAEQPRWNQHPGLYTRYGETLPLVEAIDDRFVILGAGDALRVRFDATLAPTLRTGFVRDYLLFLDGWAKDRDPNTVEALNVEPLPFHGMGTYPYGDDVAFPDDAAHRAWRVEWNLRPSKRWLTRLNTGESAW